MNDLEVDKVKYESQTSFRGIIDRPSKFALSKLDRYRVHKTTKEKLYSCVVDLKKTYDSLDSLT